MRAKNAVLWAAPWNAARTILACSKYRKVELSVKKKRKRQMARR